MGKKKLLKCAVSCPEEIVSAVVINTGTQASVYTHTTTKTSIMFFYVRVVVVVVFLLNLRRYYCDCANRAVVLELFFPHLLFCVNWHARVMVSLVLVGVDLRPFSWLVAVVVLNFFWRAMVVLLGGWFLWLQPKSQQQQSLVSSVPVGVLDALV